MPIADIREQIKVIISGVPGIGVVHDHQRLANEWNKYLALFQDTETGKINGCMLQYEKCPNQQRTIGDVELAHIWVIRKITGLRDDADTEIEFNKNVEDLQAALRNPETLNSGACTTAPDWGPMAGSVGAQLEISETRIFGNVLCHYAELRLCVAETIAM